MSELRNVLRYAYAGNLERKQLLDDTWFKKSLENTGCKFMHEKNPKRINGYKALLLTEEDAINNSTLVQESLFSTIVEGSQPLVCWRKALPTVNAESYQVRVIKTQDSTSSTAVDADTYAEEIADGATVPINADRYTKQNVDIKNYACRSAITQNLISDSQFDRLGRLMKQFIGVSQVYIGKFLQKLKLGKCRDNFERSIVTHRTEIMSQERPASLWDENVC